MPPSLMLPTDGLNSGLGRDTPSVLNLQQQTCSCGIAHTLHTCESQLYTAG